MTRLVGHTTTQWSRLVGKTKPPVAGKANQGSLTTKKESLVLSVPETVSGTVVFAPAPYDEFWFRPLTDGSKSHYVYIVYWPSDGIVKVGWTNYPSRWRAFCCRGAILLALMPAAPIETESLLDLVCSSLGAPAFHDKQEAVGHLGNGGAGYMECYRMSMEDLCVVLDAAKGVSRALVSS